MNCLLFARAFCIFEAARRKPSPSTIPMSIMKNRIAVRLIFPFVLLGIVQVNAQTISGVVNSYYQVSAINTASNSLTLNSTAGLGVGSKVMIIQMKGATMDGTNTSTFGNITSINTAGNYEFNYICSVSGTTVNLKFQLLNTYDPTQQVQLVSVPVYGSVTVTGTVTANAWDPIAGTGGILVFEATDTVYLNGTIDVSGLGYQGGPLVNYPIPPYNCSWAVTVNNYFLSVPPSDAFHTGGMKGEGIAYYILNEQYGMGKQTNGGGGGNNNNTGGAGGGNYGAGGDGGTRSGETAFQCHGMFPGKGGLSLSAYGYSVAQNRIYLGGGGGSGQENNGVGIPGGNGGGMVIITAPVITGAGSSILANGLSGINLANTLDTAAQGDGGGGGGAGGTIILNATQITGSISAVAQGARGSDASYAINDCTGPGGGGGGGTIWSAGASFPAAVSAAFSGGSNGLVSSTSLKVACRGASNGATSGASGIAQAGYVAPNATAPVCSVLAASGLRFFTGALMGQGAMLSWEIYPQSGIEAFTLESSINQVSYTTVAVVQPGTSNDFSYSDDQNKEGTIYYRLQLKYTDGSTSYSTVVALTRSADYWLEMTSMQPNPSTDVLNLTFFTKKSASAEILVFNPYGQRLYAQYQGLVDGYNKVELPVSSLAAGVYFLVIRAADTQLVKRFIKVNSH
jgi:Secretion system C-terminal sorting domain